MSLNLATIITQAFNTVYTAVDNTVVDVTYNHALSDGVYNPTTGDTDLTFDTSTIQVIVTQPKARDLNTDLTNSSDRVVRQSDLKIIVPYNNLPITPTLRDSFVINSDTYQVINVQSNPVQNALHTFFVRKEGE